MFARMDANRDGTLNETDRTAMKAQRFDRLDTDRNGSISQTELAARAGDRAGKRRMARPEGGLLP
jgi:Ca2+-binding EF-hand superfamily protein